MALSDYNINNISVGAFGATVISDTSTVNGDYQAIQVLADVIIDSITMANLTGTLTGFTIDAGTIIFGDIASIKLTSGTVIMYKQR